MISLEQVQLLNTFWTTILLTTKLDLLYFIFFINVYFWTCWHLFLICYLQHSDPSFPVTDYIQFAFFSTRSSSSCKFVHQSSQLKTYHHSFFKRVIRLWNVLPPINLSDSFSQIKSHITKTFWSHFTSNFDPEIPCTLHIICSCNKYSKSSTPTIFYWFSCT